MKRIIAFIIGFVCLGTMFVNIGYGDVIWEPDDSFYQNHSRDCYLCERNYTADGPDGEVIIYKSPESDKVIERVDNGEKLYIAYTYTDKNDVEWGYKAFGEYEGWVPMEYLNVIYDNISFCQEYADKIISKSDVFTPEGEEEILYFWSFPGSSNGYEFEADGNEDFYYNKEYVDEQDRTWVYVGYHMGMDGWICTSDYSSDIDELYPEGAPEFEAEDVTNVDGKDDLNRVDDDTEQEKYSEKDDRITPDTSNQTKTVILVIVIVVLVVLISGFMLVKIKKNGDKK